MSLARPVSRLFSSSAAARQPQRFTKNSSSPIGPIEELHARLIRTQRHTDPSAVSDVIRSYASSPLYLHRACLAFDSIERPTSAVFNFMIRGLSQSDGPVRALDLYRTMHLQGVSANHLTFIFVFKACARVCDVGHGQVVHVRALKCGFGTHVFVSNALLHMYACCSDLVSAQKVFDQMEERDLISWNSLICGYSQCGAFRDVLRLFDAMQVANVTVDAVTMVKVVLACIYLGESEFADHVAKYIEENHVLVDVYLGNTLIDMYGRRGLVELARQLFDCMRERNLVSWNAMIRGYAKAGDLAGAHRLFDEMPKRDVISWTSMITGYAQANNFAMAVKLFQEMMVANVKPDEVTVASVLSACAHLGSLDIGKAVHNYIIEHGVKIDTYVGNSLIDMYCKCGSVEKALELFKQMKEKDTVSWTSVISGLAVNGFANSALKLFSEMLSERIKPTHGTFVGVLLACAHAGLVEEGLSFLKSMEDVHGLAPEMKHYGCVVDLLSRSGDVDRAYEFITKMPFSPDVVVWRILLSSCKLHGNVVLAEIATKKLLELDPCNSGNYVLLSNTYASSHRWDDASNVRELMEETDVPKPFGWSTIESNGLPPHSSRDHIPVDPTNTRHPIKELGLS
ncbi:pentatricopeptide repeat-containing protein At2g29760, chloroplastic-like [Rhodamnia argentea]|uniref:Pentatricopeptide repeat-containing protein At2g29760, chloroplastic-like n=1 Tax=Rhodamnia argentea TaxID=178133 RepID=A0A8B8PE81_9MYRT|nr:pentatricopeptide repeat-containing protein At2g29760, chloroplastic-like [Rhodamnia argentea]